MDQKFIKSLSDLDKKKIFKTTKIKKIHFFGQNLHLNFQTDDPFVPNRFVKCELGSKENQLIITGLDWKKFNAYDIFQILKPFEYNKGCIKEVSLAYFDYKLQQKKEGVISKFYSKIENQLTDNMFEEGKKIFAQVICDSNRTIKKLYNMYNGLEIGDKNLIFDMRIVNRKFFSEAKKIEIATVVDKNYDPKYSMTTWNLNEKVASDVGGGNLAPKIFDKIRIKKKFSILKNKHQDDRHFKKKFNLSNFYPFSKPKFNFSNRNIKLGLEKKFLLGKQLDCEKL